MWLFCLHVCLCIICMPLAWGGQKGELDALEMELLTVVSHYVVLRTKPRSSTRVASVLNPQSYLKTVKGVF